MRAKKARRFNPAILFERYRHDPRLRVFESERAALDAVQRGDKPIWRESIPLAAVEDGYPRFGEQVRAAMDRGLAVTLYEPKIEGIPERMRSVHVYISPLDQTWRISALLALRDAHLATRGTWTTAATEQQSALLGYTPQQRELWNADERRHRIAFGCVSLTMYTLLTRSQRAACIALGKRPARELVGRTFFSAYTLDVKRDALALLPRGISLARVGFSWDAAKQLFGAFETWKRRGPTSGTVTEELAQPVVDGFTTNVELLTRRGWT